MNLIDFISANADYMVKDDPDNYANRQSAVADLDAAIDILREENSPQGICIFGSYILIRMVDTDGFEEMYLTKKLSSFALFPPEEVSMAYRWVPEIALDDPLEDEGDPFEDDDEDY